MGTTEDAPEKISLVSTVTQQCDWTVTSDKGRTFENVRLRSASPLNYAYITLTIFGLSPVLPEGLTIDFLLPAGSDTVEADGASGSNRYLLTANPDGKTFTLRCRDGVFTFTPQKAKTPQTEDTPQTTK